MRRCWTICLILFCTLVTPCLRSAEPTATVTSVRTIVDDGWYNQATDLVIWKNFYWLGYRRGTKHGPIWGLDHGANSFGVIWRSNDLRRWHEAKVFDAPGGIIDGSGVNCPRFVPLEDRLHVFFTVHTPTKEGTGIRTFNSWTEDGVNWSNPTVISMDNHFPMLWRVRHHDDQFYCATCFLDRPGPKDHGPLDLLVSRDGIRWKKRVRISDDPPGAKNHFTEESDLVWLPDGELWCLIRPFESARLYKSKPPYTVWDEGVDLGVWGHAPAFCAMDGEVYVSGRQGIYENGKHMGNTSALFHVTGETATVLASFDTAEDASYPGLVSPEPGKLVMTYYSDGPYAKRGAKLKFFDQYKRKYSQVDIFLAEIEISK